MTASLWVSKTGLAAQDTALRVISNNLANVSTTGFKRDRAVFADLMYQIDQQPGGLSSQNTQLPSGTQLGVGVKVAGTQKNFADGSIQNTSSPLDLAIDGRGFFQISLPDGNVAYSRAGSFQLDQDGQIVDSQGFPLEPAITVPEDAVSITIGLDGTVSVLQQGDTSPSEIGNIQLANFTNPAGLEAKGANMYLETASSGAPVTGTPGENGLGFTVQNALENSNVSVVEEMVNMVATQRAYEMNAKVVSTADQMIQYLTQNL